MCVYGAICTGLSTCPMALTPSVATTLLIRLKLSFIVGVYPRVLAFLGGKENICD